MSRRGARLAVVVLFALAAGAAAWEYFRAERSRSSHHDAAAAFERDARAVLASIVDLRAAQQAYVAAGQGAAYWTTHVSASIQALESRLDGLRARASSAEASARLATAASALHDFARMDRRARDYALSDQRLLASDLVFADGFELSRAIAAEVDAARSADGTARAARARQERRRQAGAAAGAAGIGVLFMFILALAPMDRPQRPEAEPADPPQERWQDAVPLAPATTAVDPPALRVDFNGVAELCADFARVNDTQQIPALLDRAARILDASGIVLWVADPDQRELVPTVAHGYPASALVRLNSMPRDADNVTAAAFRQARVEIVKGDVMTAGAIAAPLAAPGGCVGVMAAEVRHEREQHAEVRAVAAIIAAQLATLIGTAPAAQPRAQAN